MRRIGPRVALGRRLLARAFVYVAWAWLIMLVAISAASGAFASGVVAQPSGGASWLTPAGTVGALQQSGWANGCVFDPPRDDCATVRGSRGGATIVTVSPDGRHVYAAWGDSISIFARDEATGVLTQLPGEAGCVGGPIPPSGAVCAAGRARKELNDVEISPDGRHVYLSSGDGLWVFTRDLPSGALTPIPGARGCVGQERSGCADARGGRGTRVNDALVSGDGRHVYATLAVGIRVFSRDPATGALAQVRGPAGCLDEKGREGCDRFRSPRYVDPSSILLSPDGRTLYVEGAIDAYGGLVALTRDRRTGALHQRRGRAGCLSEIVRQCGHPRRFNSHGPLAVSPDGLNVYVTTAEPGVVVFARNRATGLLTQRAGRSGCIEPTGAQGCTAAERLKRFGPPTAITVSPDGRSVYLGVRHCLQTDGDEQHGRWCVRSTGMVVGFARGRRTGSLRQLTGKGGCFTDRPTADCTTGRGLNVPRSLAASPDGANLYAAASSDAEGENAGGIGIFSRTTR